MTPKKRLRKNKWTTGSARIHTHAARPAEIRATASLRKRAFHTPQVILMEDRTDLLLQ